MHRGDIFWADLDPVRGSEQGKTRPVLIIQNDMGNEYSPVTIIACITTNLSRKNYPTNVFISARDTGLTSDSIVLLNQIRTVDKSRLTKKAGHVPEHKMLEVDEALKISLNL
ncbi:TPA: type II toxin-antitoxin system PemK/MazF family toxin [Candidatus Bathyarchaeota archaeon]|nr:type II toxin-antitoxin system PemK/MazF family toxin [Candidatus Bathyarchaeota archaeon]HIJ07876.1 type II toxin-antitoxin system PemK/MazF family toxin [Candidatus Bathyarchaeota archaeon]